MKWDNCAGGALESLASIGQMKTDSRRAVRLMQGARMIDGGICV